MKTEEALDGALPFEAYELVEAAFLEPNQDLRIPHTLTSDDPNDVVYLVLRQSGDGTVYDSRERPNGLAWARGSVILRCNRAPQNVLLLLAVRKRR
jgi:hypothetical protein